MPRNNLRHNAHYQQLQSERDKALSQLKKRLHSDYYLIGRREFRQQYGANTVDKAYKDIQSQIKRQSKGRGTKNLRQQIRQLEDSKFKSYSPQATLDFEDPDHNHVESFIQAYCDTDIGHSIADKPLKIAKDTINDALTSHFNFDQTDNPIGQNITQKLTQKFGYYDDEGYDACSLKTTIRASLLFMSTSKQHALINTLTDALDTIQDEVDDFIDEEHKKTLIMIIFMIVGFASFFAFAGYCTNRSGPNTLNNTAPTSNDLPSISNDLPSIDQYPQLNNQLTTLIDNEQDERIKNNLQIIKSSRSQATIEFLQELNDGQLRALAHLPQQQLTKQLMEHVVQYTNEHEQDLTDICGRLNSYHQKQNQPNGLQSFSELVQRQFDYDRNHTANFYLQKLLFGEGTISLSPLLGFTSEHNPIILITKDNPQQLTLETLANNLKIIQDTSIRNNTRINDVIDSANTLTDNQVNRIRIHPMTQSRHFKVTRFEADLDFNLLNTLVTIKALNALSNYSDEDRTLTQQQFERIIEQKNVISNNFKMLYQTLHPNAQNIYTNVGVNSIVEHNLDQSNDNTSSQNNNEDSICQSNNESVSNSWVGLLGQYSPLELNFSGTEPEEQQSHSTIYNWANRLGNLFVIANSTAPTQLELALSD